MPAHRNWKLHAILLLFAGIMQIFLLTLPALAQAKPASAVAPPCGLAETQFQVKTDSKSHPLGQPEAGKALVYLLQDDALFDGIRPTTRFAFNGAWVGATHANSYVFVQLEPGEQHLCAQWADLPGGVGRGKAALHFVARAGETYYFRAQDVARGDSHFDLRLEVLDSDEAMLLMSQFAHATSHPLKK